MNITNEELQVILHWQQSRAAVHLLDDSQHNVDVVIPLARSKGKITPESLDAAVAISFRSLKYMTGHEHPVIKQELAEKAKAEADKAQTDREKRDRDRQQKNANPPPRRDPRLDRYQDQEAEQKAAEDAANDVNNEVFKRRNEIAKVEFDRICTEYSYTLPSGRTNWTISYERRELLKGIRVTRGKDAKGDTVHLYIDGPNGELGMLRLAKEALRGFERENSRRGMA